MFEKLLGQIAAGLDSRGIPYMVIGGQAVLIYGEPRMTRDVDVTLGVGPDELPRLLDLAKESGWRVLVDSPQEFVAKTLVLPCADPASGIRIDFIFSFSSYERQAIERACAVNIENTPVRFATVEDLVIHKIVSGRPRDLEDVRLVLLKNPHADSAYIRKWLSELQSGIEEDLLARLDSVS